MASVEDLRSFMADSQESEWRRLSDAIDHAVNGTWSMAASNSAIDIIRAARLVGPTPWESVLWRLVRGGVYETVLRAGGVEPTLPDEAETRRVDEMMREHGWRHSGDAAVERYAETLAAIRSPREMAWIAQEATT